MIDEAYISAFADSQWGPRTLEDVGLKLSEESGEVSGAIIKIAEGRATVQDLRDEIGDVMIVLSQMAARLGSTLEDLRNERFEKIRHRASQKLNKPNA